MKKWKLLVLREFWEYKHTFITLPLVFAGILLLLASLFFFNIDQFSRHHIGYTDGLDEISDSMDIQFSLNFKNEGWRIAEKIESNPDAETSAISNINISIVSSNEIQLEKDAWDFHQQWEDKASIQSGWQIDQAQSMSLSNNRISKFSESIMLNSIYGVYMLLLAMVLIGYCLNCLYTERKDNSILFWQSLPVSDSETVAAKLLTALVVVPVVYFAAAVLVEVLVYLMYSGVRMANEELFSLMNIQQMHLGWQLLNQMVVLLMLSIWYLPVAAYLMLFSAASKKLPGTFALMPIMILWLVSEMLFSGDWMKAWIFPRIFPPLEEMGFGMLFCDVSASCGLSSDIILPLIIGVGLAAIMYLVTTRIRGRFTD